MNRLLDLELNVKSLRNKQQSSVKQYATVKKQYARAYSDTPVTHTGTISWITDDLMRGFIAPHPRKGMRSDARIAFRTTKNLIGFTDPRVNNKKLLEQLRMKDVLGTGVNVIFDFVMESDKQVFSVEGVSLDLQGAVEAAGQIKTHYVVPVVLDSDKWGMKYDPLSGGWTTKMPKAGHEWRRIYTSNKDERPSLSLRKTDYPHLSGIALRRYETPLSQKSGIAADSAEAAMQIVRPGSKYLAVEEGEIPGIRGFYFDPADRFITAIAVPLTHPQSKAAGKARVLVKAHSKGDAIQEDPRHGGLHHPLLAFQNMHSHYCRGTVSDPKLRWDEDSFADLIESIKKAQYTPQNTKVKVPYGSAQLDASEMWERKTTSIPKQHDKLG